MSKFNYNDKVEKVKSYEGGTLYQRNTLEAWMNMLFSSYLSNQFYESSDTQTNRFKELTKQIIAEYGPSFAAKASIFARNVLGMRSVSHLVAAYLNNEQFVNKRYYFSKIVNRPDDMGEIMAAIEAMGFKRSHALIRGFKDYISILDDYTLGKYKLNGKRFNMYDIINLTHPKSDTVDKYMNGVLESPDTWEVKISTTKDKSAEWKRLVKEGKLGYMALIRNLNNILDSLDYSDDNFITDYLVPQLTNADKIYGSKIFPYRIYVAYTNLKVKNFEVITALEKAFCISVNNMPKLDGRNVIILDVSGSMEQRISAKSTISIKEAVACYATALYLQNPDIKLIKFGEYAQEFKFHYMDSPFSSIEKVAENKKLGHCTYPDQAFQLIQDSDFDRIFLFSDMQLMDKTYRYVQANDIFMQYYAAHGNHTHMYSFDLSNYAGQIGNPECKHVHLLTSLKDTLFEMIPYIENGQKLFDIINNFSY